MEELKDRGFAVADHTASEAAMTSLAETWGRWANDQETPKDGRLQLSSADFSETVNEFLPMLRQLITKEVEDTLESYFESLKKKYSIYKIEKLMIDVEGAEFKILNSINFGDIEIKEIFFEKKHFDGYMRQGKKFEEIKEKLKYHNYILQDVDEENIKAYLKE
mgnify:CR=1 FL=1